MVIRLLRMTVVGVGVLLSLLAVLAAGHDRRRAHDCAAHPPAGRFVEVAGGRLHVVDLDGATQPVRRRSAGGAAARRERQSRGHAACARRPARAHAIASSWSIGPGHGWSERPTRTMRSPARQAAMIGEMLERLDVGRAIIVAHSFAGSVATALALDDPGRVAGLVLIAPVLYPWRRGIAWYYSLAATPVIGPLFAQTFAVPVGSAADAAGRPRGVRAAGSARRLRRARRHHAGAAAADLSRQCPRCRRPQRVCDAPGATLRQHQGADDDHHRRSRYDRVTRHPCARFRCEAYRRASSSCSKASAICRITWRPIAWWQRSTR